MHMHAYRCKRIHRESAVPNLILVSHKLCPYVQRAAIALAEKGIALERRDVDLANKPDWFKAVSPLGKTPVLLVGDTAIFESAAILEYLEEAQANPLHPDTPLARAEHRGWIEFGSAILNDIAGLYAAPDESAFRAKAAALRAKFARVEQRLAGPWFDGARSAWSMRCLVRCVATSTRSIASAISAF